MSAFNAAYENSVDGVAVGYDDDGGGTGNSGGGGSRRFADGFAPENMRTCGWPERDIGDYDIIEHDYELGYADNRCFGEVRLNCTTLRSALVEQWHEVRHACSKANCRKMADSWISMDGLRQRVPIVAWAPKYRFVSRRYSVAYNKTFDLLQPVMGH